MSEPTGFETQQTEAAPQPIDSQDSGSGNNQQASPQTVPADNPAWEPFLNGVPSGLHDMMKGRLREWDAGVDERFRKVHSEYEPYKWAKESNLPGEELQQAWGFWRQASDNPRHVFDFLANNFGFTTAQAIEQGQQANSQTQDDDEIDLAAFEDNGSAFDVENHPAFKQMQEQNARMQQFIDQQVQAQNEAQAGQWLQSVETRLKTDYPNVDPQRIMAQAVGVMNANPNMDPDQIINQIAKSEQDYVDSIRSAPAPGALAPTVLSPSGGSPVAPGIGKMSDADVRKSAVEFLVNANRA